MENVVLLVTVTLLAHSPQQSHDQQRNTTAGTKCATVAIVPRAQHADSSPTTGNQS